MVITKENQVFRPVLFWAVETEKLLKISQGVFSMISVPYGTGDIPLVCNPPAVDYIHFYEMITSNTLC